MDQQRREQAPLSSEGVEERSWDGWGKRVLSVRVERRSSVPASAEASSPTHHSVEASQPTFCGVDNRERQRSRSCSTCTRKRGPTWRGRAKQQREGDGWRNVGSSSNHWFQIAGCCACISNQRMPALPLKSTVKQWCGPRRRRRCKHQRRCRNLPTAAAQPPTFYDVSSRTTT